MSDLADLAPQRFQAAQQQLDSVQAAGQLLVDEGDGRKVAWRRWGQGAPLLLFHGGGGSWQHWVRNVEPLGHHHTVWAVDLPGFGDSDGFGGVAKGISIVTRAEAPVLAPADGFVLFKGAFLNYGQILVLDAGQDYTILLAGLGALAALLASVKIQVVRVENGEDEKRD